MKNSYPLEVADYAIANNIDHEPAYAWWVPYVIKKRGSTINKVGVNAVSMLSNFYILRILYKGKRN